MKTPVKLWLLPLALLPFLFVSCTDSDEETPEPDPEPAAAEPEPEQAKGKDKGKGKGGRGGIADQLIGEYDADADGAISDYEVDEATWRFIERADENKDSKITREEFANLRPPAPQGGEGTDGDGKGKGGGGKGGRPDPAEMFARMDVNGDGKISSDEAPEFIWSRMSAADANGDGAVTVEEMQARRAARDAERAAGGGGFDGKGRGGKGGKGDGGGKGGETP